MANVRLFGETSGFVQLAAPDAAGNNTITLPTTGTELVAADATGNITIDGTATFAVGASGTPAITASGDANTGIYFPAADTIAFTEGGNEAARFDSSGRLGIGSTNPTRPLTVATPSGETVNILGVFDSSDANPATVSNCVIAFSDPTSTGGQFSTRLGSVGDSLAFYTSGANERMRILSGGGITFNGDTATANALDDYEEGTWTPTVTTGSINVSNAVYTKIGRMVTCAANISSFTNRTSTNEIYVNNLPFTPAANVVVGVCTARYYAGPDVIAQVQTNGNLFFTRIANTANFDTATHNDLSDANSMFYFVATYSAA